MGTVGTPPSTARTVSQGHTSQADTEVSMLNLLVTASILQQIVQNIRIPCPKILVLAKCASKDAAQRQLNACPSLAPADSHGGLPVKAESRCRHVWPTSSISGHASTSSCSNAEKQYSRHRCPAALKPKPYTGNSLIPKTKQQALKP